MSSSMGVNGAWRIVEMDLWDAEAIDLLGPGFIEFGADRSGSVRFIAVEGWMACHAGQRDGRPCVEFTWEDNDECDPASGRAGRCWRRTGRCVGTSTFVLATTGGFGRWAPRPKTGVGRAGVGARGGRAGERRGRPGGRSRRAADRGCPCSGPFRR